MAKELEHYMLHRAAGMPKQVEPSHLSLSGLRGYIPQLLPVQPERGRRFVDVQEYWESLSREVERDAVPGWDGVLHLSVVEGEKKREREKKWQNERVVCEKDAIL